MSATQELADLARLREVNAELLEALAEILCAMPDLDQFENPEGESMKPYVDAARAAIAKATGKELS